MQKKQLVLIDVVGLSTSLLGENTPKINAYIDDNHLSPLEGVFPALTTSTQSSILTGAYPSQHGIVGNGWYHRELAEVMFWKQSNHLVGAAKIWDKLKANDRSFKCSKLFWWYNMYAQVDASITPRPHYPADGRKIIDLYSTPDGLHQEIESRIGKFPFFNFWGPKAGIESSRWIAQAAQIEFERNYPNLQLVYLPHLDYCLQKYGPSHPGVENELQAIDEVVGELISFYQQRNVSVILLSEYGIETVSKAVHINRVLREHGYIKVRDTLTWELLDPGASAAFAVADHQCAHIYVNDLSKKSEVKRLLAQTSGIDCVLDDREKVEWRIDHPRSGDLVAVAEEGAWFTYYYWLEEKKAPDFASTVDIHRKPGYDPAELFIDPAITFPRMRVAKRLLQKKLGFRMLMDVIPTDASMVAGSHGRWPENSDQGALVVLPKVMAKDRVKMVDISDLIMQFFGAGDAG